MADTGVPSEKPARRAKPAASEAAGQTAAAMAGAANQMETVAEQTASAAGEAAKAAEARATEAFRASAFDVPEIFRSWTERSINQSRDLYARMKTGAEETTDAMGDTLETTRNGLLEMNLKTLDAAKAQADASFELARQMMGVTSLADAIELQSTFVRERFDFFVSYTKDLQSTMAKVAQDASEPTKTAVGKLFGEFRPAA
ncbi:phasin family protein [Propylenella binzhouense]|nr:phasin family protein [Propylenella binzhouense]